MLVLCLFDATLALETALNIDKSGFSNDERSRSELGLFTFDGSHFSLLYLSMKSSHFCGESSVVVLEGGRGTLK